jgi:hypothetical protein
VTGATTAAALLPVCCTACKQRPHCRQSAAQLELSLASSALRCIRNGEAAVWALDRAVSAADRLSAPQYSAPVCCNLLGTRVIGAMAAIAVQRMHSRLPPLPLLHSMIEITLQDSPNSTMKL